MYTHLRNIGPFSSLTFLILESLSLYSKLRWLFRFCLFKSQLVILISKRYGTNIYLKGCQLYPTFSIFLERKSWSPSYYVFFGLPPSLIILPNVSFEFSLGTRPCEIRFGYLQRVVFMKNF
jgi:hypothetical protein